MIDPGQHPPDDLSDIPTGSDGVSSRSDPRPGLDGNSGRGGGGREAAAEEGSGPIADARRALDPVQRSLSAAGFYAYGTLDDQHRWTIAVDDEAGRIDVRVGTDGFEIELWASSPGLYAEEENEWRRRALERLARITLPNIARGFLAPYQTAEWDEIDHGVAVRLRYELPFTRAADVGPFVRARLPELEELLTFVERQVVS